MGFLLTGTVAHFIGTLFHYSYLFYVYFNVDIIKKLLEAASRFNSVSYVVIWTNAQ